MEPNETHDPALRSWVAAAEAADADFPIQNLPFGVFAAGGQAPRCGVAIGDRIVDIADWLDRGLFEGLAADAAAACRAGELNALMALTPAHWSALRLALSRRLRTGAARQADAERGMVPVASVTMKLPARIGNFTDFYTSLDHAVNASEAARPGRGIAPCFKHLPMAYGGRASSVCISGTPVRRPHGQTMPLGAGQPVFGLSGKLDYELELGVYVGQGNVLGEPVAIDEADSRIFGLSLLNDWSARDVQAWEMQLLGPFQGKSFLTSVSPWVVTLEALAPFRAPAPVRPAGDPPLLPYLASEANARRGAIGVTVEALLRSQSMRSEALEPVRISRHGFAGNYWTIPQMIAHHTANGCALVPGDLIGTGTISGAREGEKGCLLEAAYAGTRPIRISEREERAYLEDGDEVILRARCACDGFRTIGFGLCEGVVLPAGALHNPLK